MVILGTVTTESFMQLCNYQGTKMTGRERQGKQIRLVEEGDAHQGIEHFVLFLISIGQFKAAEIRTWWAYAFKHMGTGRWTPHASLILARAVYWYKQVTRVNTSTFPVHNFLEVKKTHTHIPNDCSQPVEELAIPNCWTIRLHDRPTWLPFRA